WSICCGARQPASRRTPPRQTPSCSRPRKQPTPASLLPIATPQREPNSSRYSSWSCSWARDRQAVRDIGQEIFEIAILVRLRLQRNRAGLAVAGDEAPAGRAHAAPFRTIDRQCIQDAERGREDFGADALARALHMA